MSLLQAVETTLEASGVTGAAHGQLRMVECDDGAVEVWPVVPTDPASEGRWRRSILAQCLTSLHHSGHRVELVCRGATFVRCRA